MLRQTLNSLKSSNKLFVVAAASVFTSVLTVGTLASPSSTIPLTRSISNMTSSTPILPTLFISHGGGPAFFMPSSKSKTLFSDIDENSPPAKALREIAANPTAVGLPIAPKAILLVTAHWEESDGVHILGDEHPNLFFDYYGFPPATYDLTYPAPGHPELALKIQSLINAQEGAPQAFVDVGKGRGFDHGTFIPLKMIYPKANIPVVQMSLKSNLNPEEHLAVGKALAPLRREGVLIIASGQATHPMRGAGPQGKKLAEEFMRHFRSIMSAPKSEAEKSSLGLWKSPIYELTKQLHNPRTEHLIPLLVALGAALPEGKEASSPLGKSLFGERDFTFGEVFNLVSYVFE